MTTWERGSEQEIFSLNIRAPGNNFAVKIHPTILQRGRKT